ncbi:MAG: YkgJ family cysteine cluster protein, partial [Gammaproteobacteria bacterium]|nr:YkgJ family cysteine cluster protein [Gammaproteobacteria bacterium]MDX5374552.1 YkgJ family cysteine cluster protein [Gammaproteobacteria bacterium]
MTAINPCVECGACCATFRVSFYWAEADDAPGGTVPADLTARLNAHRRVMQGTDQPEPRCCALEGE